MRPSPPDLLPYFRHLHVPHLTQNLIEKLDSRLRAGAHAVFNLSDIVYSPDSCFIVLHGIPMDCLWLPVRFDVPESWDRQ